MTATDPIAAQIEQAITGAIPDARVQVIPGSPGHYALEVTSPAFAGKGLLAKQRMVYGAITTLMSGPDAPVHAIDRLVTATPG